MLHFEETTLLSLYMLNEGVTKAVHSGAAAERVKGREKVKEQGHRPGVWRVCKRGRDRKEGREAGTAHFTPGTANIF